MAGGSQAERSSLERATAEDATFHAAPAQWQEEFEEGQRLSQSCFWWEWQHVRTIDGMPHRVQMHAHNLRAGRAFPRCPLEHHVARSLLYTPDFCQDAADSYCYKVLRDTFCKSGDATMQQEQKSLKCRFLGVIYEGETEEFHKELPGERLDVSGLV